MEPMTIASAALERNLAWVRTADAKVSPVFAVNAGMLGVLGVRMPDLETLPVVVVLVWALAAAALLGSTICLGLVVFPRLTGPKDSVVFFGTVVHMAESVYIQRLTAQPTDALVADLARQAFRNAEIAAAKYAHLRLAMIGLFAGFPLWLAALLATRHL